MGEAGQPRKGERGAAARGAAAASGAKRRRRRRPRRASAQGTNQKADGTSITAVAKTTGTSGTTPRPIGSKKGAKRKTSSTKGSSGKRSAKTRRKAPVVPTKREISAGGVVYRRDGEEIEIVLASRRTRRGELAWGLAKGGIEGDESMEDAAVREVREETGLVAEIEVSLGETRYFYVWENVRIRKTVHFFLMRHTGGDIDDRDDEMEEIRWFPLDRALKRAAYRGERDVLVRAAELLR
jgi:8-oxo-dGTP pyrophosphatase MutT (NUDIX family)